MSKIFISLLIGGVIALAAACGNSGPSAPASKTIKSATIGSNITVSLGSSDGVLRKGKQDLTLSFADQSGKPVDVGAASLNFFMPAMGSMSAMNDPATLTTTGTPGVLRAQVNIEMVGDWQAQIKIDGAAGNGSATIPVSAQ